MKSLLTDMYWHQAWADARHLQIIAAHAAARADGAIRHRLVHILTVQRFFLSLLHLDEEPFVPPAPDDLDDVGKWSGLVRSYHDEAVALVEGLSDARLALPVDNPFAPPGSPPVSVAEALTQCVMHSQYHRGQNARRLRELGLDPPMTDLIAWYWTAREAPRWECPST